MGRVDRLISESIEALRDEKKERAEQLLRQAANIEPNNEQVWLWLSAAVDGIAAQRECLYRVLDINPHNSFARSGLGFMNRLRPGQEWKAAEAPWIMGLIDGEMGAEEVPTRTCPKCGAPNFAWAYSCTRCGADLKPIDIFKVAKAEREVERRAPAAPTVIQSWASGMVLNRERTFEPEVEQASLIRALTALLLGSLFLTLLRAGMGTAQLFFLNSASLRNILRLAINALQEEAALLVAVGIAYAAISIPTFVLAKLLGGKGGFRVHLHMTAVAVSSWLAVTAVLGLLLWILNVAGGRFVGNELFNTLKTGAVGVLFLYAIILLIQAFQTGHRMSPLLAILVTIILFIAGGLIYLGLGYSLVELEEWTKQLLSPIYR